jgi:hypothetical protein
MGKSAGDLSPQYSGEIAGVLSALATLKQELGETLDSASLDGSDAGLQADLGEAILHLAAAYQLLHDLL